jgi:hypothetical protein
VAGIQPVVIPVEAIQVAVGMAILQEVVMATLIITHLLLRMIADNTGIALAHIIHHQEEMTGIGTDTTEIMIETTTITDQSHLFMFNHPLLLQ